MKKSKFDWGRTNNSFQMRISTNQNHRGRLLVHTKALSHAHSNYQLKLLGYLAQATHIITCHVFLKKLATSLGCKLAIRINVELEQLDLELSPCILPMIFTQQWSWLSTIWLWVPCTMNVLISAWKEGPFLLVVWCVCPSGPNTVTIKSPNSFWPSRDHLHKIPKRYNCSWFF